MENIVAELVFIPAPGVGHINPTVEIARLLVNRDQNLSITILVIKPPSHSGSGLTLTTDFESLAKKASSNRISFVELPQDETPPMHNSKTALASFKEYIDSHCKHVRNFVADMISTHQSGSDRRVVGFVIDMLCTEMIDVANEFNVPTYVFYTSNASFLGLKFYSQSLYDDENEDVVSWSNSDGSIPLPGFVKPVPTKVFPTAFKTRDGLDLVIGFGRKVREAKGIILNTFLELETHAIESLSFDNPIPPVYPVGPILNLEVTDIKPSDNDVIAWLDSQPSSSVVFLCFGSMGGFDEVQVKEIADALERSGHRFVWTLRPSPTQPLLAPRDYEDPGMVLPEGFLERTAGLGKVIGWAPQVAVLAHHAVGGFVSHCGWNSLLESLWFGVPTAAWPIYAEQQLNAFKMVVELGLAVEIKLDYRKDVFVSEADTTIVSSEEIERGIRQLMEDNEVRTKVKEMSKKSRATVMESGSSYASFGSLIQDFIRNIS